MMLGAALHHQLSLLPERFAWHILLSMLALSIGIALSLPLAVVCLRVRVLRGPVLALASVIQTVPSLALLALMVVVFATIGFIPAIVALVLYSMLPILRNTVTGIAGVDAYVIEAARGVGMTERQLLFKVQFPLAAPIIIAGIRTAAVWVCGIATLSTPVGQTSLGNYIFEGLQLRNNTAVTIGIVAAAILAISLDLLIRLMEMASERRSARLFVTASLTLCLLFAGGISPLIRPTSDVVVGAKTFTEQYVLAEAMTQRLRNAGFRVRKAQGMGSSILFDALANGSVDCYVDYSGTLWTNVLKRSDRVPPEQMIEEVKAYLEQRHGVLCLGPLGFENTYALAMRRDRAAALGIRTASDLARHTTQLKLGGDYEFFGRPEWMHVRELYELEFAKTVSLDSTLMYPAVQSGQVDVIAAFSTDGRIAAYDLLVLNDNRRAFPSYDALLLISRSAASRRGFVATLVPLVDAISNESMRQANKFADVDGMPPSEAAKSLAPGAIEIRVSNVTPSS
jgi:osmoprotectant transport system permease protein